MLDDTFIIKHRQCHFLVHNGLTVSSSRFRWWLRFVAWLREWEAFDGGELVEVS